MRIRIKTSVAMPEIPDGLEMEQGALRDVLLRLFANMKLTRELVDPVTGEMNFEEFFEVRLNGVSYHALDKGLDTQLRDGDLVQISLILLGGG